MKYDNIENAALRADDNGYIQVLIVQALVAIANELSLVVELMNAVAIDGLAVYEQSHGGDDD